MKSVPLNEAKKKLTSWLKTAQKEVVVVTKYGKPVAYITGCQGQELEDILATIDPEFRMLQEARVLVAEKAVAVKRRKTRVRR